MDMDYNSKLFAMAAGLVASGYDLYDAANADGILDLARDVGQITLDEHIYRWFKAAKTGQVAVNPYWPRGHVAIMATYFCKDEAIDLAGFMEFYDKLGIADPVGRDGFCDWLAQLPQVLAYMQGKMERFLARYWALVGSCMPRWLPMLEQSRKAAADFFGDNAPQLIFAPNLLFSPYATDFVRVGGKIVVIATAPDAESVLHEALHDAVGLHRDKIIAFAEKHGLGGLVEFDKMMALGYMHDDSAASCARAIEECIVRAVSVMLARGGKERLKAHAADGFVGVLRTGDLFGQIRPSVRGLGGFIAELLPA